MRLAEDNTFPFRGMEGVTEEEQHLTRRVEEKVLEYYKAMTAISKICIAAIAHSLGMNEFKCHLTNLFV